MEVLHQGFDKLDVAVRGQMTDETLGQLEQVKTHAEQINDVMATWVNDLNLIVHPTGRRGGYKFVCDTDYGRGPILALGAIFTRRVSPAQAIAIDEDNAAQNPSIIDARHAMALGKVRPQPLHLSLAQPI